LETVDGILLDLGLSSDQLEQSGRGFSFQKDEPLDMRFSPEEQDRTASDIINESSEEKLREIFRAYGEEEHSARIAKKIVSERSQSAILTTGALIQIIQASVPNSYGRRQHPATKVFQALRIAVNNELENVALGVNEAIDLLSVGGRLAVISFHSLEDRVVKRIIKREATECLCPREIPVCRCGHEAKIKLVNKKPIVPSEAEVLANPRCRSAKLRIIEKIK